MPDPKYCYPDLDVLINKLGIRDQLQLFEAEKRLTSIRLNELQQDPIKGKFDFNHLKKIHNFIFQDIYEWAGEPRTVEIGKGNLFCTVTCIQQYADSVFKNYFPQCFASKENISHFIKIFAKHYGDLNALHPFREGNGRAQREFARIVCLECGFDFCLANTTHEKMLRASIASFNNGDNSLFEEIFYDAVSKNFNHSNKILKILTKDDLEIVPISKANKYESYDKYDKIEIYNNLYKSKIQKMQEGISLFNKEQMQSSTKTDVPLDKSSFASIIEAHEQPSAAYPPSQGIFDLAFSKTEQNEGDPMKKSTDQGVDR